MSGEWVQPGAPASRAIGGRRRITRADIVGALIALGALAFAAPAYAECSVSATGVSFGAYDVFTVTPTDSVGSVTFTCQNANPVQVTLSTGSSATFSPRTLRAGGRTLNYNLYLDAARSSVWGDGTGGTNIYTNRPPPGKPITVPVYGRIFSQQDVPAGAYGDTIVVTLNH